MLNHLHFVWKHNLGILVNDQMFQPLIFHNRYKHTINFGNKQQQIFHKFILLCILHIRINNLEMFCDGPITNTIFWFWIFLTLLICNKSQMGVLTSTPKQLDAQAKQLLHKSDSMLLVIGDHTILLFIGVAKIIHLEKRMANHTMHGLNTYKIWFSTIINHKK